MATKTAVKVFRFDPAMDDEPYFQTYEVPVVEGASVLDVLDYIRENFDGGLAYYAHAACQQGICRRCVLVVNGEFTLICQTSVEGDLTIEPPKKTTVVRDLVFQRGGRE